MNIKKYITLGSIILVVLIGTGVLGTYIAINQQRSADEVGQNDSLSEEEPLLTREQQLASEKAVVEAGSGNIEEAVATLDQAIEATKNTQQQAVLYVQKSSILASTNTNAALEAALASYELNRRYETADYIALLYEQEGNTQKALEYYREALRLYNETAFIQESEFNEPRGVSDASYYEQKIEGLQG